MKLFCPPPRPVRRMGRSLPFLSLAALRVRVELTRRFMISSGHLSWIFALTALHAAAAAGAANVSSGSFNSSVKPLLETHCVECHDEETHKAGLRLDTLPAD